MEEMFVGHPEWGGKVVGMILNQGGADAGVPQCSNLTTLSIVQDDVGGSMWSGLGAEYDSILVVDQDGIEVLKIAPTAFPQTANEIEDILATILGADQ